MQEAIKKNAHLTSYSKNQKFRIVVLGGYGNFGTRICRALATDENIDLIVAGRNLAKAQQFAATLTGGVHALALDALSTSLAADFFAAKADLVIHTAGPFQAQGYAVANAAATAGAHYIDLADGRQFVCDFSRALDQLFQNAGKVAITGASTVPALSSAVVDALSIGWQSISDIEVCIAPAQTAPRGLATMVAVLSYCGKAIKVWQGDAWQSQYGWLDMQRIYFMRMRPRLAALCDIPDLQLFPAHYVGVNKVIFRAALEIGFSQRGFSFLAACVKRGWVKKPERLAKLLLTVAAWMDVFGSALGGMVVRVTGMDAHGQNTVSEWHIAADDDHGPEIPCMAAIILAKRLARHADNHDQTLAAGATTSMNLCKLDEFEPYFASWGMQTDFVSHPAA